MKVLQLQISSSWLCPSRTESLYTSCVESSFLIPSVTEAIGHTVINIKDVYIGTSLNSVNGC